LEEKILFKIMFESTTTVLADSSNFETSDPLSNDEMIEMLKDLAAVKEKLHKWQQSLKKLETFPESDANKCIMNDIINL
jgi:alpha-N-acetylglucosamine transferase